MKRRVVLAVLFLVAALIAIYPTVVEVANKVLSQWALSNPGFVGAQQLVPERPQSSIGAIVVHGVWVASVSRADPSTEEWVVGTAHVASEQSDKVYSPTR